MKEDCDLETWIIEFGGDIIQKEHDSGALSLSPAENAVYDLWAVDYAVRNAGDMEALDDIRPTAATDLAEFLNSIQQQNLAAYMKQLAGAGEDCDSYYERFSELCQALQSAFPGT